MNKWVKGIALAASFCAAAAGTLAMSERGRLVLADIKRETRLALGLPKKWIQGFHDNIALHTPLPCPADPIVIITGGQSNASNAFDPVNGAPHVDGGFTWFDGQCYGLKSPVLGATGRNDSLWPRLGSALYESTRQPVLFIHGAVGGSQLGDWLDHRSNYLARLLERAVESRAQGFHPDFVLWIQGETDAKAHVEPQTYVEQMRALIGRFEAAGAVAPHTKWVVYRSTRCLQRPNNGPDIEHALTQWADASHSDPVISGPRASELGDAHRRDGCHFNTLGRDELVSETIKVMEPHL
jgi:hypothetical protein